MTYDTAAGVFLSRGDQNPGDPPRLGIIDPLTSAVQVVTISGLPVNQQKVNGIEYWAAQSSIVVTFGAPPNNEERLAQIDLSGVVLRTSANLGLGDRDVLAQNPLTGDLLAIDFNDLAPRLAVIQDPFGILATSAYVNPPVDGSLGDAAVSPATGQVFACRVAGDNELVRVNVATNDYSTIGMFGTSSPVVGIAFVPEQSTVVLFVMGAATAGVLRLVRRINRKNRKSSPMQQSAERSQSDLQAREASRVAQLAAVLSSITSNFVRTSMTCIG